jgi:hypothetical protein
MSDTDSVVEALGFFGDASEAPVDPSEGQPDAAESTATSTDASDDDETISLEDALAELDGQAAPETEATAATDEPETEPAPDVAELQRQLDAYKAKEAEVKAKEADAAFDETWDAHIDQGYAFYDTERERIKAIGIKQGRTEDEIELAIYRRVVQGIGRGALGEQEWERQTLQNRVNATRDYLARKTAPSQLDHLVSTYALDDTQRTALAKFINYPPDHLEEIARTFGAQNQRLAQTQQHARNDAVANVTARLVHQTAPGTPGAAPKPKRLAAPKNAAESRQLTEFVSRRFGLLGPTG